MAVPGTPGDDYPIYASVPDTRNIIDYKYGYMQSFFFLYIFMASSDISLSLFNVFPFCLIVYSKDFFSLFVFFNLTFSFL